MNTLQRVIDADPSQLRSLAHALAEGSAEAAYAQVRLRYMEHRSEALKALLPMITEPLVLALASERLALRLGEVKRETLLSLLEFQAEGAWLAEVHNVIAMGLESLEDPVGAKAHYLKSHTACLEEGLAKRAATTFHNAIAAESRAHPEKRLIYEYHHAYRMALDASDFGTAGTALSNLAREYQLMKALSLALKYINEAVELLERTHYGTYQYINALCNRCHLLLETGQWGAAKTDYQQIACFDMSEAKAALETLAKLFATVGESVPAPSAEGKGEVFTWRERRERLEEELGRPDSQLSQLEGHLILSLSERPRDKHELAAYLYGRTGDPSDKENRLKQILYRIRRKCPGLIVYENGMYRIAEPHLMARQG